MKILPAMGALILILSLLLQNGQAQQPPETKWLAEAGVGVFTHFLPGKENFSQVQKYDVQTVANQLEQIGAKYFVFTIYQNSGYFNAPNTYYDQVTGYAPGERTASRDLPLELAEALALKNIKLILYVTAQTPNRDARAQQAFGLEPAPRDLPIHMEFATKWAKVLEEWSLRYGEKVAGWWVDGSYAWVGFNEEIASQYSTALKRGNPHAIIAFNPGVKKPEWKTSDYTAGEINLPFEVDVTSQFKNGQQMQILTFLGDRWGADNCRFSDEQWIDWVTRVTSQKGAVTLDAAPNLGHHPNSPIGTINDRQLQQLRAIYSSLRTKKE